MSEIIVTTREELETIIRDALAAVLPDWRTPQITPPDTIALSGALELLRDNGYPTSRAKIYKLTSARLLPHRKYGNRLVFSRRELLMWAESQTRSKDEPTQAVLAVARSAARKK